MVINAVKAAGDMLRWLACLAVAAAPLGGAGVAVADPVGAEARVPVDEQEGEVPYGYPLGRSLSPITPEIAEGLREIAQSHDRRDDVFAKVGDSMSESRAFLQCFAWGSARLDGRDHLRETIEYFDGNAGGDNPFSRDSEATEVGWRTISVLRGPLDRELRQTRPRFATLMFGTNDMQSGRPWIYARRMWRIVDELVDNGTIPIMSSILPRSDSARRDRQVPLYSLVSRALAQGYGLPFIDYHHEMERLPRRGLAGDGLHANVLVEDGRSRPCDFTEKGLEHGHNIRNLRHIQMLDRLRRVVLEGEPAPDPSWPERRGDGTPAAPFEMEGVPYTRLGVLPEGRHVYELALTSRTRIHVRVFARSGSAVPVVLRKVGAEQPARSASGRDGLVEPLEPGLWRIEVAPGDVDRAGTGYMLLVDRLLPDAIEENPFWYAPDRE